MMESPTSITASSSLAPHDHPLRAARLEKLQALRESAIDPYPHSFNRSHAAEEVHHSYGHLEAGQMAEETLSIAGRIMAIRNSGMFIDLHDATGKIQAFCHADTLNQEGLDLLKLLDLGDFLGVEGIARRTPRGELTVNAQRITLLAKALLPLPEKYHGLNDLEIRYRQRYLDLMVNEDSRSIFRKRSQIIQEMRQFLLKDGFLEVETPMLHTIPGGAAARPFITHHNTLDMDLYLRIAPELYLKRLLIGGLSEKVFEINRCFRNEGISTRHNPEFTTIEIYQAYADYTDMMSLTETLIAQLAQTVVGTTIISFQGREIDLTPPWRRVSMVDLITEAIGVNFGLLLTDEEARQAAQDLKISEAEKLTWGHCVEQAFAQYVEPSLVQPLHVIDLPREISPLAKSHRSLPRVTERFETYINGWEIANAFSELTDPLDQRERFLDQVREREAGSQEAHHMDHDFVTALEYGMPPTGGLGIGIDRLVMLLTDSPSIREVIAFPTMRPKA